MNRSYRGSRTASPSGVPVKPKEIPRTRLLDEFEAAAPRLVVIAAPAGYGKSSVARQIAAGFDLAATCDCAAVENERGLWYAILAAVGRAAGATRSGGRSTRADAGGDPSLDNVLALLGELDGSIVLVIENAETAFVDPALRRALQRLVAASPRSCTTLLCARTSARIALSKFAPPHEMLVWRARDLAFDRDEISAAFGERGPDLAAEVYAATSGWPVAVLFLQRFAHRAAFNSALTRIETSDYDELYEYLVDEIVSALSADELNAVLTASVVPETTIGDIARALPDKSATTIVRGLVEACPLFVQIDDERYELHPLLRSAVKLRFDDERRRLATALASSYAADGHFVRAAQIYAEIGNVDAMAQALIADNTAPERKRSISYSALLATLDDRVLAHYPILQALTIYWRRFRVDPHLLREQTEIVWEALRSVDNIELRANVGSTIARLMYETGAFSRAEAILRTLETEYGGIGEVPQTSGQAYVARTLGCIAARSGRLSEADRYFKSGYLARPGAEHLRSRYFIERAVIERLNGRVQEEQRLLELAVDSSRTAQAPVQLVCALAEAAFGAWFRGDDAALRERLVQLDHEAHANGYIAFLHFCAVGNGVSDAGVNGTEQPNWLACAYLIAAAAGTGVERIAHARAAKEAADASNELFLQVLAGIAVALSDPARHEDMATAAALATRIEAPAFRDAVKALAVQGHSDSLLGAFVRRFHVGIRSDEITAGLRIDVLSRRVYRNNVAVDVGERQVALLVALARERRSYPRDALIEELWPMLAENKAREALNSCVYRIRSRLSAEVIVYENDAYRLGDGVRVDLRDLERSATIAGRPTALTHDERRGLEEAIGHWTIPTTELPELWEFLSPILIRCTQMVQTIAERLAFDALRGGDPDRALTIARELITSDPCDEQARDIAIRALLAKGQRSSAVLELRNYQKILWRELEVHPSAALTALLNEDSRRQFA